MIVYVRVYACVCMSMCCIHTHILVILKTLDDDN